MPKMSFTDFLPAGAYRLRRAAVMTVGVLFMGFAVAALVLADLGTDPFTTACLAFAARMGWLLGSAELLINAVMFCLVLWQDPHRIGLGTLANMCWWATRRISSAGCSACTASRLPQAGLRGLCSWWPPLRFSSWRRRCT